MERTGDSRIPLKQIEGVLQPISEAHGMPNDAYTSDVYFAFERDNVFGPSWTCIGFAGDLPQNAYVKPVDFMGLPLLIIRNREGEIQVFHNVCSHRGMKLVKEAGELKGMICCPYHSWAYDLNGKLVGTPHIGGMNQHRDERFRCEKHGLKPLRSTVWMGLVFVNLSGDAEPFEDFILPLAQRWKAFVGENGLDLMRQSDAGENLEIEVACNWKLAVENYCEAYHLPGPSFS